MTFEQRLLKAFDLLTERSKRTGWSMGLSGGDATKFRGHSRDVVSWADDPHLDSLESLLSFLEEAQTSDHVVMLRPPQTPRKVIVIYNGNLTEEELLDDLFNNAQFPTEKADPNQEGGTFDAL